MAITATKAAPVIAVFSQSMAFLSRRSSHSVLHLPGNTRQSSSQITCSIDKTPSRPLPTFPTILFSPAMNAPQTLQAISGELPGEVVPMAEPTEKITKNKKKGFANLIFRIIRPHVVFGTFIGFAGVSARTWMESPQLVTLSNRSLPLKLLAIFIAVLGIDGFINGINQIFDRDIDKINKPYLPIPSGDMSLSSAWMFVLNCAVNGIATALAVNSKSLLLCFLLQLAIGTIYSVPPFSTKRSTYGAVLTCASMRGYAFTFSLFAAARAVLGLPLQFSPPVIFLSSFTTLICVVLGTIKDVPDIEGDTICNVPTLASIYGPRRIAYLCFGALLLTCAGAAATPYFFPEIFKGSIMTPAHVLMGLWVAFKAWKLDRANYNKEEGEEFYQSLWKLLNIEYMLLPFI